MTADEWLTDLEAKAKAATPGAWHIIEADDERFMSVDYVATTPEDATPENVIAVTLLQSPRVACIADEKWDENAAFIAAANPAAVLRLVGMVRAFAAHCAELGCPHRCPSSDAPSLEECTSCWITHVYNAAGGSHD